VKNKSSKENRRTLSLSNKSKIGTSEYLANPDLIPTQ
jgi:hypothetical protein